MQRNKYQKQILEDQIRKLLSQRLKQNVLSTDDIFHICTELGDAENEEEMRAALERLVGKYKVLSDVLMIKEREQREDLHGIVQGFVSEFIKVDPLKAAKLADMSMGKKSNLEELFEFSKEFEDYYKQHHEK